MFDWWSKQVQPDALHSKPPVAELRSQIWSWADGQFSYPNPDAARDVERALRPILRDAGVHQKAFIREWRKGEAGNPPRREVMNQIENASGPQILEYAKHLGLY